MTNSTLTLAPIKKITGEVQLIGSKSISNRALLLAALSTGNVKLANILDSDDVRYMLKALTELGVQYDLDIKNATCVVQGCAGKFSFHDGMSLYLGNAGTAMRPLTAALALLATHCIELTGDPRMKERPIGHLVDALCQGGAKIEYVENENYPPLRICGGFKGGNIAIDGSLSSQFLTALLMIAPLAENDTRITIKGELVSTPYIDITLKMMADFGINVINENYQRFIINANQQYIAPKQYLIEGDASSASYFLAAAAIKGGVVKVKGIGKNSIQGDVKFADVLEKMGAKITFGDDFIACERGELNGVDLDLNHIPDAAMTIAVVALFAKGKTTIRNIYNWRVKETDRLAAMAKELRKVGAVVDEGHDFISITPPEMFLQAEIETYDDHRMAMCFSLVALSDQPVIILDPDCTNKTFPNYFDIFASMCEI